MFLLNKIKDFYIVLLTTHNNKFRNSLAGKAAQAIIAPFFID